MINWKLSPLKIVIYYTVFGVSWIISSDVIVSTLARNLEIYTELSIVKGCLYVLTTSALLYCLIKSYAKQRLKAEEDLRNRLDELERFMKETVKREFTVKELKDKIKELEEKLKSKKEGAW